MADKSLFNSSVFSKIKNANIVADRVLGGYNDVRILRLGYATGYQYNRSVSVLIQSSFYGNYHYSCNIVFIPISSVDFANSKPFNTPLYKEKDSNTKLYYKKDDSLKRIYIYAVSSGGGDWTEKVLIEHGGTVWTPEIVNDSTVSISDLTAF